MTEPTLRVAATLLLGSLLPAFVGATPDEALERRADFPPPAVHGLEALDAAQVEALHAAVAGTLDDATATVGEQAEAVGEMGRFYHALERLAAAESCYRLARDLSPRDDRWPYYLGVLLEAEERFEEAAAAYESALTARVAVAPLMRLARVYGALGRTEAARRNEQQALRLDPDVESGMFDDPLIDGLVERAHERAGLLLGRIAFRDGRFGEAVDAFEGALTLRADSVAALVNLGLSLSALGRTAEAIARFEQAAEVAPVDPAPRLQLGLALLVRGDAAAARPHLEVAVALAPEDPAAHTALAEAWRRSGDPEASLEHYRRAIGLDPNLERPRMGEAQALMELGRYMELREQLQEASRLFPNSGRVLYALAWTLATSLDAKVRDASQALELAQQVFDARRGLEDAVLVAAALAAAERCAAAASFLRDLEVAAEDAEGGAVAAEYLRARIEHFEQGPPCLVPPSGRLE